MLLLLWVSTCATCANAHQSQAHHRLPAPAVSGAQGRRRRLLRRLPHLCRPLLAEQQRQLLRGRAPGGAAQQAPEAPAADMGSHAALRRDAVDQQLLRLQVGVGVALRRPLRS
jgi:hypothetical protein